MKDYSELIQSVIAGVGGAENRMQEMNLKRRQGCWTDFPK